MAPLALRRSVTGSPPRWARPLAIAVGTAAACGLAVTQAAVSAPPDDRLARAVLEALVVGVPVATGFYAVQAPRTRRFGVMLVGAGLIWSLTSLGEASQSLPYSVGRVSAWLIFPLLAYLMLAFPDGRLRPGPNRRLFVAATSLVAVLYVGSAPFVEAYSAHTPWATCDARCPANAFLLLADEPAVMAGVVAPVREALAGLVLIGVTYSLATRWRTSTPLRRHMVGPVIAMSILSTVTLVAYLVVRRIDATSSVVDTLGLLWALSIPGVAAAFLVGFLRRKMMVGDVLSRLSLALGRRLDARELRNTLRAALPDRSLDVLLPDGVPGRWRDTEGRVTFRSAPAQRGLAVTPVDDENGPAAALVHDPSLCDEEDLLQAVSAFLLAAVRNERLLTRLEGSLGELERSRARIARAADLERSRIERDLHDGAQQRLIGLRIRLSLAEEQVEEDPAAAAAAIHELATETEVALEELRSLAHGVYPALLHDRGLADALRSVVGEAPLAGHVSTHGLSRQPAELETAVYFTCLEAVQNAVKHAPRATGVWVTLRQARVLRFEVRDDGPGFTPPANASNGGLRNMRDRIEAVGGQLTIDAAPGQGTRVRGTVPLS
jgi:signal transduction histidine kinase